MNLAYRGNAPYSSSGVDMQIEFCLAAQDPFGNPTNGVNRINASGTSDYSTNGITISDSDNEIAVKALSIWPNSDYYNIWIVSEINGNDAGGGTQGYAYFPGAGSSYDGTVIMYNSIGYDADGSRCFDVKNYTNLNTTLIHELGHALGLEHPWEKNDGDWATDGPDEVSPTDSVMEYVSTDTEGNFYLWFSEIDVKALEELWGKAGEVPPVLSLSPYSKLEDRDSENPIDQIFLAATDDEHISINYSFAEIKDKESETDINNNSVYQAYEISQGVYIVQHPDMGKDTFIGFHEIRFTDQTISLNIPDTRSEYPNSSGEVTSGLTEGAYLKYTLSSTTD